MYVYFLKTKEYVPRNGVNIANKLELGNEML